jgi:uncharacterized cupredoxin-like copper-binding protein
VTRIRFVFVIATGVLALLVVVPIAGARAHVRNAQSITVKMTEFKFALSPRTARHGTVTFHLVNKGKLAHDLKIAGKTSAMVHPGKSASLTVTLKKGKYPYSCTVPGHAAAGMKGVLTVA